MNPVREGPKMVWVYFKPVAPGNPEACRMRVPSASSSDRGGLDGADSSGHRSTSAKEAATIYGLEEKDGFKEMRRGP